MSLGGLMCPPLQVEILHFWKFGKCSITSSSPIWWQIWETLEGKKNRIHSYNICTETLIKKLGLISRPFHQGEELSWSPYPTGYIDPRTGLEKYVNKEQWRNQEGEGLKTPQSEGLAPPPRVFTVSIRKGPSLPPQKPSLPPNLPPHFWKSSYATDKEAPHHEFSDFDWKK